MKSGAMAMFAAGLLLAVSLPVQADNTNPIQKVLSMIDEYEAKIVQEGEKSKATFEEFSAWCEERSKNVGFDIKTGKAEAEDLSATIEKDTSDIASYESKIEDLTAKISTAEEDLKAATKIREKEAADFAVAEKDLLDTLNALERAIAVLKRELPGSASFAQIKQAGSIAKALSVMVEASMLQSQDAAKLTALVQEGDDSEELGAPSGAVYESHSGDIIGTLESLHAKAKSELDAARGSETTSRNEFEMLKGSLEDELKFSNEDLDSTKKSLAETGESKATATGDLAMTSKALKEDTETLNNLKHDCMAKAEDYEAEVASRNEELKALGAAKKAIAENTGGAESLSYGLDQVSLVQLRTGVDLANFEAVRLVRDIATKEHSEALAQLATRMSAALRLGAKDPFAKIKGLITDMIERLEKEAQEDATKHAYCQKEMGETAASKKEKEAEISKLSTKIDSMKAKSAQLKEEVAVLQKALADLTSAQAESDKMRLEESTEFKQNSADMKQGLEGIKLALKILNEYYAKSDMAHSADTGAGSGIIGMLEVCESDFTKGLSEMTVTEENAKASYEKETAANEISKTTKEADVKYKTKEAAGLDKETADASSDRRGVQAELDAVMEYSAKITDECVAKPEPYEERKRRRDAELAGLKQALEILEGETMFVQKKRSVLRGVRRHM